MNTKKAIDAETWTIGAIALAAAAILPTLVQAAVSATPLVA
jgi:hypothetical protein